MLTIGDIRGALIRGDVNVMRSPEGLIEAVKVAPFDLDAFQVKPFEDCPLPLFLAALVSDGVCAGLPADRTWPGSWYALYEHGIWRGPDED